MKGKNFFLLNLFHETVTKKAGTIKKPHSKQVKATLSSTINHHKGNSFFLDYSLYGEGRK